MSARSSGTTNRMGVASSLKSSAGISRAAHWNGMLAHSVARRPASGVGGVEQGHLMARMKVIYTVTWPNGKIYVGKDLTGTDSYFGSADPRRIEADFTPEQCRDLIVRKEILWESQTATDQEVNAKEVEFILLLRSNDPAVGYNR